MPNNSCNYATELYFDFVAVFPIPFGELTHQVPFNVRKPTTAPAELGITDLADFLSARKKFLTYTDSSDVEDANTFLIEEKVTVKATPKKTIAGYTYTVSLQFKTVYSSAELREYFEELITKEHDLLLEASNGEFYFVRCPEHAYQFNPEENIVDSYTTTLTFEVNNINGVQLVVE